MLRKFLKPYAPPAVELQEFSADKPALTTAEKLNLSAHVLGGANFATIFAMFAKESWHQLLELKARFALFNAAALIDIIYAGFAWHDAWKSKKPSSVVRAAVYTFVAAGITTAVVGLFAAHALFAVASPYIFGITLGLKAAYFVKSAIWNAIKLNFRPGMDLPGAKAKRNDYKTNIVKDVISATIGAVATVGVTGVFILLKPFWFPVGIASGALGAAYAVGLAAYKIGSNWLAKRREAAKQQAGYAPILDDANEPNPGNGLTNRLGRSHSGRNIIRSTSQTSGATIDSSINRDLGSSAPASTSRANLAASLLSTTPRAPRPSPELGRSTTASQPVRIPTVSSNENPSETNNSGNSFTGLGELFSTSLSTISNGVRSTLFGSPAAKTASTTERSLSSSLDSKPGTSTPMVPMTGRSFG